MIILDGKGIGKGGVRYIDFGEAIEKRGTLMLWLGGAWVVGRRVYRFWGLHKKAEYIKAPVGSDDFCFCDPQGKCCEGNQY